MIQSYDNLFSLDTINQILSYDKVIESKNKLKNKQTFTLDISLDIQEILYNKLGLSLTQVPMTWIQGDTLPHTDKSTDIFEKTYLIYLTDSEGELIIEDNTFSITKNTAYVFNEGLYHETRNTGNTPRLIMGPMNEKGLSVGASSTIVSDGNSVYIRENSLNIEYTLDNSTWNTIYWPCTIINTSSTSNFLKVEFISDITLTNDSNKYFICGSDYIQFGSNKLKNNGSRPIITIDNTPSYNGLINNGSAFQDGYNHINIFNLKLNVINGSFLSLYGGWIGQRYFSSNSTNNYIINCSVNGDVNDLGGGIVGSNAAQNNGSLDIIGCSNSGDIYVYAGGIVGSAAGNNGGSVNCKECWTTGLIGSYAGGIFGSSAGNSNGSALALNCYSIGLISDNGGGIYGSDTTGLCISQNCYSLGMINTDAGGIFGSSAGLSSGICNAINCYSNGVIITSGNGIYGSNKQIGATTTHCYSSNNSWSNSTANTQLTGIPNPVIGITWVARGINTPYELLNMGYSPYTIENINTSNIPSLNKSFTSEVEAGNSTYQAIKTGLSYEIIYGQTEDITINEDNGTISTSLNIEPNNYTLYIRNNGSYNITTFNLTVIPLFVPLFRSKYKQGYRFTIKEAWPPVKKSI